MVDMPCKDKPCLHFRLREISPSLRSPIPCEPQGLRRDFPRQWRKMTHSAVFPRLRGQVAAQHLLLQTMGGFAGQRLRAQVKSSGRWYEIL